MGCSVTQVQSNTAHQGIALIFYNELLVAYYKGTSNPTDKYFKNKSVIKSELGMYIRCASSKPNKGITMKENDNDSRPWDILEVVLLSTIGFILAYVWLGGLQ